LIKPAVFEAQIIEESQRLAGEPAQFVVVAFGLEFADDHQRNDHLVFGEPRTRPGIG
jgi:hypothetical protein